MIGGGILFFVFYKPPVPTPVPGPKPSPQPKPTPRPPSNSWPMEKEVFFVKVSNNPIVWDSGTKGVCLYNNPQEHVYATVLDFMRMYQGYKVPSIKDITDAANNGLAYNLGNSFDLYLPWYRVVPISTTQTFPANLSTSVKATMIQNNTNNNIINVDNSNRIDTSINEIIYPVYGYKPIQSFTDAKDILFMRKNRTERSYGNKYNGGMSYYCPQGSDFDISPITWSANPSSTISWFSDYIKSMEILPFNANSWRYYGDEVVTTQNMTEGKELFLIKTTNPSSIPTLSPGYTFGTVDQFQYSAAQGANNCIDGWLKDSSVGSDGWLGGMHSNSSNPTGIVSGINSGTRQQLYAQSYGTNNWDWVEPYTINMTADGYVTQFSLNENIAVYSEIPAEIGFQDRSSYYTIAENVVRGNYNPVYYFVWGIKPKDPKTVSPDAISIEPFMVLQSGSKYSMYD